MTYSINLGKGKKMMSSDTHFKQYRKKPTISIYDENTNIEIKIASFNSQETFEIFLKEMGVDI